MRRFLLFAIAGASATALLLAAACSSDDGGGGPAADAGADVTFDVGTRPFDGGADAGPQLDASDVCGLTEEYINTCLLDLPCGSSSSFETWCPLNVSAVDSPIFDDAEKKCLTPDNCALSARHTCEYQSLAAATLSPFQTKLVQDYCATCVPGASAACITGAQTYDTAAGPQAVTDLFLAATEYDDTLTQAITTQCTGSALAFDAGDPEGGADASAACAKAFSTCYQDVYKNAIPLCQ